MDNVCNAPFYKSILQNKPYAIRIKDIVEKINKKFKEHTFAWGNKAKKRTKKLKNVLTLEMYCTII